MILSWVLIGVLVGLLLGLTGSGGSVVALPLLVHLTGASLREATVLSLAAVSSGALLNWLVQRSNTNYVISGLLFAFSVIGGLVFRQVKEITPEPVILSLFLAVCLLSLLSVWRRRLPHRSASPGESFPSILVKSAFGGFILGGLVTMTGLGGGVILVPLLTGVFGFSLSAAAATSLLTIVLSTASSLVLQWNMVSGSILPIHLIALVVGSVASALGTHTLLRTVSPTRLDMARKAVLTFVLLASGISLLLTRT